MSRYVPSGRSEPGALPLALMGALAAGLVAGLVLNFVGQWFRLLILFPLAMGFAVAIAVTIVVDSRKLRSPSLAGLAAALGGLLAWTSDMGMSYRSHRGEVRDAITAALVEQQVEPSSENLERTIDWIFVRIGEGTELADEEFSATVSGAPVEAEGRRVEPLPAASPLTVFVAWLRGRARLGTTITRSGASDTALGETGTWILWLVELLVAAGIAAWTAGARAREAFCERCNLWFPKDATIIPVGPARVEAQLIAAAEAGDLGRVGALIEPLGAEKKLSTLKLTGCARCSSTYAEVLRVKIAKNGGQSLKVVYTGLVEGEGVPALVETARARLEAPTAT